MIKYAALISVLVVIGEGQRSPYAGSAGHRYPQVLPRFQEEQDRLTSTTVATTPAVGNRVGEESANSTQSPNSVASQAPGAVPAVAAPVTAATTTTTTTTTSELPVLALGQADFVDRIKTWPEDQRPFWYLNREQIAAHLNPVNPINVIRPGVSNRGTFEGKK